MPAKRQVILEGTIYQQRPATYAPLEREDICCVEVECDGLVPVVARGELASQLAALQAQTWVRITGRLVGHQWRNGDRARQRVLEVEAETIEVAHV